jgi:hypothetical protein
MEAHTRPHSEASEISVVYGEKPAVMVLVHIFKEAVENASNIVQGSTGSTLESSVGRNANTELSLTYLGKHRRKVLLLPTA